MHVGHAIGRRIRLDVDAGLRSRAAGIREVRAIDKDVLTADQAPALPEILVEDAVGDGDILAWLTLGARANIKAIAAGLITRDAADGYIAGPFEIEAMAIFAAVAGVLSSIFRLTHFEDNRRGAGTGDGDVLGLYRQHFVTRSVARVGLDGHAGIQQNLRVRGKRNGIDVVSACGDLQGLAISRGGVQCTLQKIRIVTAEASATESQQIHRRDI